MKVRSLRPDIVCFMGRNARLEDPHIRQCVPRLRFRQPDGADVRLAEHRRRDVGVIERSIAAVEQVVGDDHALRDSDRRQLHAIDDVADRVDVVDAGAILIVDRDRAALVNATPASSRPMPLRSEIDRSRTARGRRRASVRPPVRRVACLGSSVRRARRCASNCRSMCFSRN